MVARASERRHATVPTGTSSATAKCRSRSPRGRQQQDGALLDRQATERGAHLIAQSETADVVSRFGKVVGEFLAGRPHLLPPQVVEADGAMVQPGAERGLAAEVGGCPRPSRRCPGGRRSSGRRRGASDTQARGAGLRSGRRSRGRLSWSPRCARRRTAPSIRGSAERRPSPPPALSDPRMSSSTICPTSSVHICPSRLLQRCPRRRQYAGDSSRDLYGLSLLSSMPRLLRRRPCHPR